MASQIKPAILAANPTFARLYQHLSSSLLTSNGETTSQATSGSRQEALETAKNLQMQNVKTGILEKALKAIAYDGTNGLDSALRERCLLVAACLKRPEIGHEEERLLGADFDQFQHEIASSDGNGVSHLLRQELKDQRDVLLQIGTTSKSSNPPKISTTLSSTLRQINLALDELQLEEIPAADANLAESVSELQSLYREEIELLIEHLEQHTHGIKSRFSKTQAEYYSHVSAGMAAKARILLLQARQSIYTEDVQDALKNYEHHLYVVEERLEERERQLQDETRLFEEQGERRMHECGKRYVTATTEIQNLKAEIDRLESKDR